MRLLPKSLFSYRSFLSTTSERGVVATPNMPENSGFALIGNKASYFLTDLIGVSKLEMVDSGAAIEFLIEFIRADKMGKKHTGSECTPNQARR